MATPPPSRLAPALVAKPWGRRDGLPAPEAAQPLGEVIFGDTASPLIIKLIQTAEALSIQVHPDGRDARPRKNEWWLVLEARDGAYLHLGLTRALDAPALAAAARDGSITGLLHRFQPRAGDSFYVPSGTIHALGPGLTVLEVQEPSDITYRLYDYGRPRELHLEEGLPVSLLSPAPLEAMPGPAARFGVQQLVLAAGGEAEVEPGFLAVTGGSGALGGEAAACFTCWRLDAPARLRAGPAGLRAVRAWPRPAA